MANDTLLSSGKGTEEWARNLRLEDFELLCLDDTRKPVTEAKNCHLAVAPNHAVISRTDKVEVLQQVLFDQQVWAIRVPQHILHCMGSYRRCSSI